MRRRALVFALAILPIAVFMAGGTSVPDASAATNPAKFRGVNWADSRDNFANDEVVPSGLSKDDDYATTYAKATAIAGSFKEMGFNTIRLPVNPHSVGNAWWNSYTGAIDAILDLEMNVLLSYWEGGPPNNDGVVDNLPAWWSMWETIVDRYEDKPGFHFGPMNEPHGYSSSAWANLAASWLAAFPDLPRDRVFVSGHGYSENLSVVCNDARLNGTYLALHNYAFWNTFSYAGWISDYQTNNRLAGCAHRTILEEFGVPMTSGLDFSVPPSSGTAENQNYVNFLRASTDLVRNLGMGSIYWPGLRTGDSYRLTSLVGTGTDLSLTVTNQSALDRLTWAWGPDIAPPSTSLTLDPAEPDGLDGWYVSPVQAYLNAVDAGEVPSGVAETVYSRNGGNELTYSFPVFIGASGTTTFGFRSRDVVGNWESAKSVEVKIDAEAPASELTIAPGDPPGVYTDSASFELDATDGHSGVAAIEYRIDGGQFGEYTDEVEVTAVGEHLLEYRAIDVAGNVEATREFAFEIVPSPTPALLVLKAKPKNLKLNKKGKGTVKVTVRNSGGSPAASVTVCAKAPKKLKGKRCQSFGTLGPGAAKTKAFKFNIKPKKGFNKRPKVSFKVIPPAG